MLIAWESPQTRKWYLATGGHMGVVRGLCPLMRCRPWNGKLDLAIHHLLSTIYTIYSHSGRECRSSNLVRYGHVTEVAAARPSLVVFGLEWASVSAEAPNRIAFDPSKFRNIIVSGPHSSISTYNSTLQVNLYLPDLFLVLYLFTLEENYNFSDTKYTRNIIFTNIIMNTSIYISIYIPGWHLLKRR